MSAKSKKEDGPFRAAPSEFWNQLPVSVPSLNTTGPNPLGLCCTCPQWPCSLGYVPDLPDHRDYGWTHLKTFLTDTRHAKAKHVVELHKRFQAAQKDEEEGGRYFHIGNNPDHPLPPVENQGNTNSCTANAAVGLVEYLYRWATGEYDDFSRLFIYYNARKLLGLTTDKGTFIRTTFKALRVFGVPPEKEWPFDVELLNQEPKPYHYAYASNFKTMNYARVDGYGQPPGTVLKQLKQILYTGFPVEFGFPVYSSIQNLQNFLIPVPGKTDKQLGGHAVLAVGYNEDVVYLDDKGESKKGAIIIRNSWGAGWGDHGYAFLPYWYFENAYTNDFWTAYDRSWLKLEDFDGS